MFAVGSKPGNFLQFKLPGFYLGIKPANYFDLKLVKLMYANVLTAGVSYKRAI